MATKGGDGMPGALKYQTWTLKVPIHCEGCSRKVKRVLHSIDGVFTISVNSQQHKVEVTGDVDSETLIKKLTKSGKQAELWPDQKEKKSSGKSKNKNKNNKQENPRDSEDAGEEAYKDANGTESEDNDGDDDGENHASENKETGSATKEAGGKKKKKKKKGKNKNDGGTGDGAAAGNPPGTSSGFAPPITGLTSMNPLPSVYYTPQMHGMSYNAAYPSPSTSYYGASPMHAYSYSHPGSAYALPPPSDPIKSYVDDDHDYDDGDGGCSIM